MNVGRVYGLIALLVLCGHGGRALAADAGEVAYLAYLDAGCRALQRQAGTQSDELRLLSPLWPGDRLSGIGCPQDAKVRLQYLDGELRELRAEDWPYQVRPLEPAPGTITNMFSWMFDSLRSLGRANKIRTISTKSRGDADLELPWAVSGAAYIAPRRDRLWLHWQGGSVPFSVRLYSADGRLLHADDGIGQRRHVIPLPLSDNVLRVVIGAADGLRSGAELHRFDSAEWARMQPSAFAGASPDLMALALLAHDAGRCQLEAYQLLADAADATPGVALVRRGLELGSLPEALAGPPPAAANRD